MKYLFSLLFIILLGSCLSSPSYSYTHVSEINETRRIVPIYVDKYFAEEDQKSISLAIDEWNLVLNGAIKLEIVSKLFDMAPEEINAAYVNNGFLIMKISSNSTFIPEEVPGKTLAWVDASGTGHKMYVLRDRFLPEMVKGIVLHELGHLLGAEHTPTKATLMYPEYNKVYYQCIDQETSKDVARYQFIRYETVNYCFLTK